MNREQFLMSVEKYIESDPEAAAYVADYVQSGLRTALNQANERAADMEVALSVLASRRYKNRDAVVKEKLSKWKGQTALRWDWVTDQ